MPLKDKFALSSSSHITWCHRSLSGATIPFDRSGIETQRGHTSRPRVTHGVYGILMSLPLLLPPSGKLVMVVNKIFCPLGSPTSLAAFHLPGGWWGRPDPLRDPGCAGAVQRNLGAPETHGRSPGCSWDLSLKLAVSRQVRGRTCLSFPFPETGLL